MREKRLSTSEIKLNNRQRIYKYIRKEKSVSKQDIVVGLQLSLPTVTQNLQYLKQKKLIDTSKKISNTGGRNATAYSYVKSAKTAIGIYTTGNHIHGVAVDLSGEVIYAVKERIKFNLEDDAYLRKIGEVVECIKSENSVSTDDLLGIGIAVPGLISEDGETVRYGLTLGFSGKTKEQITKYIPYSNRLLHDSYAAGYAEGKVAKGVKNAFYISLSGSVGGSIIINYEIYRGDAHKGGEIGHMTLVPEGGELCYCGKKGCFDTLCKAGTLLHYTDGVLEEFFILLEQGDNRAKELWEQYLENLSLGIHNVRILFDGKVILGGHIGPYITPYFDDLCEKVDKRNTFGDQARDYLLPCKYKVEAAAAGAANTYIDEFVKYI